jgi:ABC-type dipeptide/oligopeptide/nickel transport system permease subunit
MGLLNILITGFTVIIVLVIFMQPVLILNDEARDSLTGAGSTVKYGTDSEGNVVPVGTSSALPDITTAFLWMIGFSIVIGFIIWVVRYGRGGVYDVEGY